MGVATSTGLSIGGHCGDCIQHWGEHRRHQSHTTVQYFSAQSLTASWCAPHMPLATSLSIQLSSFPTISFSLTSLAQLKRLILLSNHVGLCNLSAEMKFKSNNLI